MQIEFFLRVHRGLRSAIEAQGLGQLTPSAVEMLLTIAEHQVGSTPIRVGNLITAGNFGTPPTARARLKELRGAKLITSVADPESGRVRRLVLSSKAMEAFAAMSEDLSRRLLPQ